jgi:hypothetical protein
MTAVYCIINSIILELNSVTVLIPSKQKAKNVMTVSRNIVWIVDRIAAWLLLLTGGLKVIASFQSDSILNLVDPILLIRNSYLYMGTGLLEIAVACVLSFGRNTEVKTALLCWIAGCFAAYRYGWHASGIHTPCPCLGTGFAWWPWLQAHLSTIGWVFFLIIVLLATIRAGVFMVARKARVEASPAQVG